MNGTYDTILQLPLFQGLTRDSLTRTIEQFSFNFEKFQDGEQIVKRGTQSTHVIFIMNGKVRSNLYNERENLKISEVSSGPSMITFVHMYGVNQTYASDFFAVGTVGVMTLEKQEFFKMIQTNEIFYYNILNHVSLRSQFALQTLINLSGTNSKKRFAMWLLPLTNSGTDEISLTCRKTNLASILGLSRPTMQTMLEEMQSEGLLTLEKGIININDRNKLCDLLNNSPESEM